MTFGFDQYGIPAVGGVLVPVKESLAALGRSGEQAPIPGTGRVARQSLPGHPDSISVTPHYLPYLVTCGQLDRVSGNRKAFDIHFSENQEEWGCLCTFPHNDYERLNEGRVRDLALLGAAVVLIHEGRLNSDVLLPRDIPDWIVKGIDRILPNRH